MPHPLFERHAATIERALAAIAERGYWSPYSDPEPEGLRRRRGRGRQGGVRRAARQAVRARPAGHRRHGRPRGLAVRLAARHHLSEGRRRRALRGDRRRGTRMAQGGTGSLGRRRHGDPAPDQPPELPLRQRGDAHDGPGVHDGVPGGRAARAGPRARSHRLRLGRNEEDSRHARGGRSRRARTSRSRWRSTSGSCRAASGS